jgi:uncharacterized integral membrane protein
MLSSDDTTQTTRVTEAIERVPRPLERRSPVNERRQSPLRQKQTDVLPQVTVDTPHSKVAWRQVIHLREENRRLRFELEEQRAEMRQLVAEYTSLQTHFEKEVAVVHSGYQQEKEQYQSHLLDLMDERNRLLGAQAQLEHRYQDLYHSFQDAVEEEAQKMVTQAAQTLELSPDSTPLVLQDVMKTLELQVRREEDKHLVEALYLKREVQRMAGLLEQERALIAEERQRLLVMQNTAREQAELRQKTLQLRLRSRWKARTITTTIGMICLLVILQFLFLNLAHVKLAAYISFLLLLPIIICSLLAFVFSGPLARARESYYTAFRKKKTRKN